jgi:hypothetical protein
MSDEIESVQQRPGLFRNYVSLIGAAIAVACLASILLLFLIEVTGRRSTPYIGIFAWVIIPSILVASFILIGIGLLRERRRRRNLALAGDVPFPSIDLNDPSTAND